jgi:hypothetical protein
MVDGIGLMNPALTGTEARRTYVAREPRSAMWLGLAALLAAGAFALLPAGRCRVSLTSGRRKT